MIYKNAVKMGYFWLRDSVYIDKSPRSVVRFVVVVKPQGLSFDPGLANYVYRTTLATNLGSWFEDKHRWTKRTIQTYR